MNSIQKYLFVLEIKNECFKMKTTQAPFYFLLE